MQITNGLHLTNHLHRDVITNALGMAELQIENRLAKVFIVAAIS